MSFCFKIHAGSGETFFSPALHHFQNRVLLPYCAKMLFLDNGERDYDELLAYIYHYWNKNVFGNGCIIIVGQMQ